MAARKKLTRAQQMRHVADTVESEGFHYAFIHYSDFIDVDDPEFYRLREAYVVAAKALQAYIGEPNE